MVIDVMKCACCGHELNDKISRCCKNDVEYSVDGMGNEFRTCTECGHECETVSPKKLKKR